MSCKCDSAAHLTCLSDIPVELMVRRVQDLKQPDAATTSANDMDDETHQYWWQQQCPANTNSNNDTH